MYRSILTLLLLAAAGCSLVIDEAELPVSMDLGLADVIVSDVDRGTVVPDSELSHDGSVSVDATSVSPDMSNIEVMDAAVDIDQAVDLGLARDNGLSIDMTVHDAGVPDAQLPEPDAALNPDASLGSCMDVDCQPGLACAEGFCEPAFCPEDCNGEEEDAVCSDGCCPSGGEEGYCSQAIPVELGSVARHQRPAFERDSLFEGSCGGVGSEAFYRFTAEEGGLVCIGDADPNSDLVLYVMTNCCEASEIACADNNGRRASKLHLEVEAGRSYLIVADRFGRGVDFNNQYATAIRGGPCPCEIDIDCPVLHACVEERCESRSGLACQNDVDCGYRGDCWRAPGDVDRVCVQEDD